MAKRKITEPALLQQKGNKKDTFQDRMDRLIGQSPFEERNQLRRQLQDEIYLKVIGNEKQKELESRLEKLSNRDFFMSENKEYLAKRKDYLDKIKFKMEKDALDKRGETIQMLNERDKNQEGGLLSDDREKFVFGASALAKIINNLIKKSSTPKQFKNDKVIKELDKTVEYHQNRIKNHDYEAEIESIGRDELTNEELMELSPEFDKFEIENILRL